MYQNEIIKKLSRGQVRIQNPKVGEKVDLSSVQIFETLGENPTTKEISEKCTAVDDLFCAGQIYHYIRGRFYQISVHDISEITFSYPSILDHFGYQQIAEDIERMLQRL